MDGAESTQDHCCVDRDQNDCESNDFDVILQVFLECLQYATLREDFKVHVLGPFVKLLHCISQLLFKDVVKLFFEIWLALAFCEKLECNRLGFLNVVLSSC